MPDWLNLRCGIVVASLAWAACGVPSDNENCSATSIALPSWLTTNMTPGAKLNAAKLKDVSVGMSWRQAVREDSTLSVYVRAPQIYLDGQNLNTAEGTIAFMSTDIPVGGWSLTYTPEPPLQSGLHKVRVVVEDLSNNVFEFNWEFCLETSDARSDG